jgi:hypothetical protein
MRLWTWDELKTRIENELDIQSEYFIDEDELLGYANEAIDEVESEVHNLYEGYFKSYHCPTLVSGTSEYALPSDIFANKILLVQYDDGTNAYKVTKIRDIEKPDVESSDDYRFDIENSTAGAVAKLVLYPASRVNSSTNIKMWYIRNANRLSSSSDTLDVPESANLVIAYCKYKCAVKAVHPMLQVFVSDLERQRQIFKETLSTMIPDEDKTIDIDFSFYDDFGGNY